MGGFGDTHDGTVSMFHLQAVTSSRNERVNVNIFHHLLIFPFLYSHRFTILKILPPSLK